MNQEQHSDMEDVLALEKERLAAEVRLLDKQAAAVDAQMQERAERQARRAASRDAAARRERENAYIWMGLLLVFGVLMFSALFGNPVDHFMEMPANIRKTFGP